MNFLVAEAAARRSPHVGGHDEVAAAGSKDARGRAEEQGESESEGLKLVKMSRPTQKRLLGLEVVVVAASAAVWYLQV